LPFYQLKTKKGVEIMIYPVGYDGMLMPVEANSKI